jgi:hypothetical protein
MLAIHLHHCDGRSRLCSVYIEGREWFEVCKRRPDQAATLRLGNVEGEKAETL